MIPQDLIEIERKAYEKAATLSDDVLVNTRLQMDAHLATILYDAEVPDSEKDAAKSRVAGYHAAINERYLAKAEGRPIPDIQPEQMTTTQSPGPDPLKGGTIGTGGIEVVQVWKRDEPERRYYVIAEIMPELAITALYGDGGNGKTLLATYAAICIVTGRPFLNLPVLSGPVLYVDAELEVEEFTRRAYKVARGMGLDKPPEGLFYVRLPARSMTCSISHGFNRRLMPFNLCW
jgi:hypothetical protein